MATGPHITFRSGGIVMSSGGAATFSGNMSAMNITINTAMQNMSSSLAKASKSAKKLELKLAPLQNIEFCNVRRGGPRSRVFCEVPVGVEHDNHAGRSPKGNWFHWKDKVWD